MKPYGERSTSGFLCVRRKKHRRLDGYDRRECADLEAKRSSRETRSETDHENERRRRRRLLIPREGGALSASLQS